MPSNHVTIGSPGTPKVAVVSHERSGTHFLMNTLALNFGYINRPWWNFDFETGLNMHSSDSIRRYLQEAGSRPVLNIFKSHHPYGFFADVIEDFVSEFRVLYIYRDPRDVMVSNWRLLQSFDWDEGPRTGDIGSFLRAAPRGGMMRYQKIQEPTVLHRWQTHVTEWVDYAEGSGRDRILAVRYEDLNLDFESSLGIISRFMGKPVTRSLRPARNKDVVGSGPGRVGAWQQIFRPGDNEYVLAQIGSSMRRLGYA